MPNNIVLNFHDSIIRDSDMELLDGPYWLNDSLIGFYLEYLQYDVFKDCNEILFISPEVTQCLKGSSKQELPIFLEPLEAHSKQFIFLPLNNCEIADKPGGSHWSLLIYSRPEQTMYHLDSASGFNLRHARKLVSNIAYAVSQDGCDFEEYECLQQENSYDCGIFVVSHAEMMARHCEQTNELKNADMLDPRIVSNKRKDIKNIIHRLAQEAK